MQSMYDIFVRVINRRKYVKDEMIAEIASKKLLGILTTEEEEKLMLLAEEKFDPNYVEQPDRVEQMEQQLLILSGAIDQLATIVATLQGGKK